MEERKAIIKIKNLVAGYGSDIILERVSFEVYEGEIFGILGGSGCGKSTLLKHMIGLLPPLAGQIFIDGEDITRCHDDSLKKILRKIGVLYQNAALFGSMTLAENIELPIKEYSDLAPQSIEALIKMKLDRVNLDGYQQYLPSEISGGMQKRAGLARAMALNPKILFFDEPSAGLDPITSAELDKLMLQINQNLGTTLVIVTHELQSIFKIAQRVILLDKLTKGILEEGAPHFLKENSKNAFVRQFFNRQTER